MTPEEAEEKPTSEPFLMRVLLRRSFFNYGFSDILKWNSYQMRFHRW
jgi:hypothetical protein